MNIARFLIFYKMKKNENNYRNIEKMLDIEYFNYYHWLIFIKNKLPKEFLFDESCREIDEFVDLMQKTSKVFDQFCKM